MTGANLTLPEFVFLTEGEEHEICVVISDAEESRQRDIHISFSVISNDTVMGDFAIMNKTAVILPGESEACLHLVSFDDDVVEDDEHILVVVESTNPSDRVDGNTSIIIFDNDSMCRVCELQCDQLNPLLMHAGVNLRVNGSVNLTEGEVGGICVTVDNHEQSRERVIPISVSSVSNSATIGMLCTLALNYSMS